MSVFASLEEEFDVNWTTMLVGWNGLGEYSPWPDRKDDFLPLYSTDELAAFANKRFTSSIAIEEALILKLLSLNLCSERRETIRGLLMDLATLNGGDPKLELRKWRLVLLEDLLTNFPADAVNGLVALTEFWECFGYPVESPHEVQGRGNEISPSENYQDRNLKRLLARHWAWLQEEKTAIKNRSDKGN
ncbi:MAG: DUF2247 family protein [Planctomycetaceae bacterium]